MSGVKRNNARMGILLAGVVFGMIGMSYAAVPLYQIFCQVTGFGGTTQVAEQAPSEALERTVKVRFNADTNYDMPWDFAPETREVEVRLGQEELVFYKARNATSHTVTGVASYNVTPAKTGIYFSKVQCFCFNEQTLAPGEEVDMGVYFFVDPALADDPGMDDVTTITLSYTFFMAEDQGSDGPAEGQTLSQAPADESNEGS